MKPLFLLFVAVACFLAFPAIAQDKIPQTPKEPKTKLEAFEAKTGVVIVHGFAVVGSVDGRFGSSAEIECKEFTEASTGKKEYGITITVKETSSYKREHVSYIDYDEVDSLLKGIDYIAKIDKTVTKLDDFQADYHTKGELRISTYSDSQGKVQASVESGTYASVSTFLSLDGLAEFKGLIVKAKARLDSIRAPNTL